VPEQLLHLAEVRPGAQELGGEDVAECVRRHALALADARRGDVVAEDLAELRVVERLALDADEERLLGQRQAGGDRLTTLRLGRPERNLPGLAERDRLTLLALVTTGLRRSELCALEWRDLELDGRKRSLLVRSGKGGKPRRQPLPAGLARELRKLRDARQPAPTDPVFCRLAGGRLQETILADIIRRAAKRAGIEKHVTAHTLRHTAATWLRRELGDTRLVAEYLGHADLSTVARHAHVEREELFAAAGRLEQLAVPAEASAPPARACNGRTDQSAGSDGSSDDASTESVQPRRRRRRGRRRRRR